jgi:hypothetical protein
MTGDDAGTWPGEHADGLSPAAALDLFDRSAAVDVGGLLGRWRGRGLPTGHPLDGLLEAYGWHGKEFLDAERVHPLLFRTAGGAPAPVDPALAPVGVLLRAPGLFHTSVARALFPAARALLSTGRPAGRLRRIEHRGVFTAALIYDRLPAIDVFRQVADATVLGLLDLRGLTQPFFFLLEREPTGG